MRDGWEHLTESTSKMEHRNFSYKLQGRFLSLNKCFKTLSGRSNRLRDAIKKGSKVRSKYIKWVVDVLKEKHLIIRGL
jgi:hypothetical protein